MNDGREHNKKSNSSAAMQRIRKKENYENESSHKSKNQLKKEKYSKMSNNVKHDWSSPVEKIVENNKDVIKYQRRERVKKQKENKIKAYIASQLCSEDRTPENVSMIKFSPEFKSAMNRIKTESNIISSKDRKLSTSDLDTSIFETRKTFKLRKRRLQNPIVKSPVCIRVTIEPTITESVITKNNTINLFDDEDDTPFGDDHNDSLEYDLQIELNEAKIVSESFSDKKDMMASFIKELSNNPEIRSLIKDVPIASSMCVFLYQLLRSRSNGDYIAAFHQFGSILYYRDSKLIDWVNTCAQKAYKSLPIWSEGLADTFESFCAKMEMVFNSEFLTCLRDFICAVVSFKVFDKDVAKKITGIIGSVAPMSLFDFIPVVIRFISKGLRFFEAYASGITVFDFLTKDDPIAAVLSESNLLISYEDLLYTGLPVDGKMCMQEFLMRGTKALCFIESSIKMIPHFGSKYKKLVEIQTRLLVVVSRIRSINRGGQRNTPFGLILHSTPGAGKSRVLIHIAKLWSKIKGRTFNDSHIFTRVVTSPFVEGYDPDSHPIIHYSELGSDSAEVLKSCGDVVVGELTSVVDSLRCSLNMAAVELKGKVLANPELVLCDTNKPDLNLKKLKNNPTAYWRRFLFMEITVKDEFCLDGSTMIDPKKSFDAGGNLMNRWNFKLYKRLPLTNTTFHTEVLYVGDNIDNVDNILIKLFRDHIGMNALVHDAFIADEKKETILPIIKACLEPLITEVIEPVDSTLIRNIDLQDSGDEKYDDEIICESKRNFNHEIKRTYVIQQRISNIIVSIINLLKWIFSELLEIAWCLHLAFIIWLISYIIQGTVAYAANLYKKRVLLRAKWAWYRILGTEPSEEIAIFAPSSIAAHVGTLLIAYSIFRIFIQRTRDGIAESAKSNLISQSDLNKKIHNIEEEINASDHVERLSVKNTPHWNIINYPSTHVKTQNSILDVYNKVKRNIRPLKILTGITQQVYCLGIKGNICIANRHIFDPSLSSWKVASPGNADVNSTVWHETIITKSNLIIMGEDLVMFRMSHFLFTDITDYICTHFVERSIPQSAYIGTHLVSATYRTNQIRIDSPYGPITSSSYWKYMWPVHGDGACGTPLIVNYGISHVIGGIHFAGGVSNSDAYSVAFTKGDIQEAIINLTNNSIMFPIASEGLIVSEELVSPGSRSPFRYEILHGMEYFGKRDKNVMISKKSEVLSTPYYREIQEIFNHHLIDDDGNYTFGPPPMKPFTRNGEYFSPWNEALKTISHNGVALDQNTLVDIHNLLFDRLKGIKLCPLTMECAINGVTGDPFARRINATTAAGANYPGKKYQYIPIVEEDQNCLIREPTESLKRRLVNMMETYQKGEISDSLYSASLKDEARSMKKNNVGKTRVFFGSPIDVLILQRMFLYPFYSSMIENSDLFCCALGIDMHRGSDEWVKKMLSFSESGIEGDMKEFDQRKMFEIAAHSSSLIYNLCKNAGYSTYALNVVAGLLTESLFPVISMCEDIFRTPNLQVSGKYATAEENTLFHLFMLIYSFVKITKKDISEFFKYVKPSLYGDDSASAVKISIQNVFNNFTFSEFCKTDFNMVFTPADKAGDFRKVVPIMEMSFLKRTFRYSNNLERYVAPLMLESIVKMNSFYIPSKNIPKEHQLIATLSASLWEYFFHIEEEGEYEGIRDKLIQLACKSLNLLPEYIEGQFPTYVFMVNRFSETS